MSLDNDTANKILASAKELFAEFGFEGARIDEIAKRAGVNKAMIYYHFKSKEELYQRVLDSFFKNLPSKDLKSGEDTLNFWDQLMLCIRQISDRVSENKKERCSIIAREMVSRGDVFQMMRDKYWIPEYKKVREIIQRGIEAGEFKKPTQALDFIVFTIFSHIIFYRINEVTYTGSEIYPDLYPENNKVLVLEYLSQILRFLLIRSDDGSCTK